MRDWRPAITEKSHYGRKPPVGEVIGWDGSAYRVLRVDEVIPGDWSERSRQQWLDSRMPDPWTSAPFRVIVADHPKPGREKMMLVEPWHFPVWHVLPEHYAVCAVCGDLAPCRGHRETEVAKAASERVEKDMAVLPGFCPACNEPITSRQATHIFPGPNLLNPLAEDIVRYHARQKCRGGAVRYENLWVNADPARQRTLLTLRCEGTITVHGDGSAECHGAQDCPHIYAQHRAMTACYLLSHGCGKGCSRENHPGTRLANGLTSEGFIP